MKLEIEEAPCNRNNWSKTYALSCLREIICFLITNYDIIRGESIFECELSYLWDFVKEGGIPYLLNYCVLSISIDKMNSNRTLYEKF